MEKIIEYNDLPLASGESVYLRMGAYPRLYLTLLSKGYKVIQNVADADDTTIYITGCRQSNNFITFEDYKALIDKRVQDSFHSKGINKPRTQKFSYDDLVQYRYQLPFVLKNENQNGGREKFLIRTEVDYERLICACDCLIDRNILLFGSQEDDLRYKINYAEYLDLNFTVQEYIPTPSEYNTTVRLLTSSSGSLLYAALKYKKPEPCVDDTTLLGYLLSEVFPLSTNSIVSNTLSGGKNVLIGESNYSPIEQSLISSHGINTQQFKELVHAAETVHEEFKSIIGILCGFDFIYDDEKKEWLLLEYHSRPMVGDYSKRQGINYQTKEDHIIAEGRVRATALSLSLKKD